MQRIVTWRCPQEPDVILGAPTTHAIHCTMGVVVCAMIFSINSVETGEVFDPDRHAILLQESHGYPPLYS
jgi:hypothetical protein